MRLEALFLEKAAIPDDLRALHQEASKDKALVAFLRQRPYFRDMKQLKAKVAAAKVMPEKVEPTEALQAKTIETSKVADEIKKVAVQDGKLAPAYELYYSLTLKIAAHAARTNVYTIQLQDPNGKPADDEREVTPEEIDKRFRAILPRLGQLAYPTTTRDSAQDSLPAARNVARANPMDYTQTIQELGLTLYNWFFQGKKQEVEALFLKSLEQNTRLRLLLDIDPKLNDLPWESLYIPGRDLFLGKDERYSLVRLVSPHEVRKELLTPLKPPLRVLALLSSPADMPTINIEREAQILQETMLDHVKEGNVELNILTSVTVDSLQMALVRYRPDLVHFVGHGVYDQEKQSGVLLVEDENGHGRPLYSESIRSLLADQSVRAVVLNGCHTGSAGSSQDVTTGIAGMLVEAGIPLVVATLREVWDDAALLFSRSFYGTLAAGTTLEAALAQSRKRLDLEGFDWTIYALYASTSQLNQVMFVPRRPQA